MTTDMQAEDEMPAADKFLVSVAMVLFIVMLVLIVKSELFPESVQDISGTAQYEELNQCNGPQAKHIAVCANYTG